MFKNILNSRQLYVIVAVGVMLFAYKGYSTERLNEGVKHQPIVEELIGILDVDPDLKKGLEESIRKADRLEVPTLEAYYIFLDGMVTLVPSERNLFHYLLEFYYLIDNSPRAF